MPTLKNPFTRVTAVFVLIGMIAGTFVWLDTKFVSAGEFKREQQQVHTSLTGLKVQMIEMTLRQIESELYERMRENEASPSDITARRIRDLNLDKTLLLGRLNGLRISNAGEGG